MLSSKIFFLLLSIFSICTGACKPQKSVIQQEVPAEKLAVEQHTDSVRKGELSPEQVLNFMKAHPKSDLRELWRQLEIEDILDDNPDSADYQAEKFVFEIGKEKQLVMLRISHGISSGMPIRHLFFGQRHKEDGWKLLSYEDEWNVRYGVAVDPYIEVLGDQYWVVISSRGWFGSGIGATWRTWYSLDTKEAKGVLQESEQHQFIGAGNCFVKSESKAAVRKLVNGSPLVILNYTFGWEVKNPDESFELFTKRGRVTYRWNASKNTFLYDKASSSIEENFEKKFELKEDVGFTVDLSPYFIELMKVAKQGSRKQKDELASILDSKEQLQEIRGKKEMRCLKELRFALHSR